MKVLKFSIHTKYFEDFKNICIEEDITIKRKLNVLLAQDYTPENIREFFPEEHLDDLRKVTLKCNEELYKGVMKKCGKYDLKISHYMAYLIYQFLNKTNQP